MIIYVRMSFRVIRSIMGISIIRRFYDVVGYIRLGVKGWIRC